MHKDVVTELPPGCHLLLKSEKYPIHSFVKHFPDSTSEKPLAHVLTIQGHPEFTPAIINHITDVRAPIFGPEATVEARRRAGGKDGTGGEGHGRLGWAVWRVMLQRQQQPQA